MLIFSKPISLKARIMLACVLLTSVIVLLLAFIAHSAYEVLEEYIFSESLQGDIQWLDADRDYASPHLPEGRRFYTEITVPAELRSYPLGYSDIGKGTTDEWHIYVFERNDRRYYLLQDGSLFERLERIIDGFLIFALLVSSLVALWVGWFTASRVIAPIIELADAVRRNETPFPFQSAQDEIGILARTFARHSDDLQEFLEREKSFVSDASHELRTPLAIIMGAAEVIVAQSQDTSGSVIPAAQRIAKVGTEMNAQLSAMLLLSRAPETLDRPITAIAPIIQACIEHCQSILGTKPVQLEFACAAGVNVDAVTVAARPELVQSVIFNLLRNACQYTERGNIKLFLSNGSLSIEDSGPGLPSNRGSKSFERLFHPSNQQGEGLGLSIVQRIVKHLGWQLHVQTSPEGSRFDILFYDNGLPSNTQPI